jgi:hypothetical protein
MKLFLAVTATLAMGALAQTPAGAPEADADLGQTSCDVEMPDGETMKQICDFYQECHTSKNTTKSGCIPKGNKVCDLYSEFGTTGNVIENNINSEGCKPFQTCCDLECCNPDQVCIEQWSGRTISYGGSSEQSLEHIARNGWKTMKGVAVVNKPRTCVDSRYKMDPTTGFKAVYMPLCGLATTAVIFVLAIVKNQESILEIIFPLLVILTSFYPPLSEGWIMALLCTFVAAATMATGDQDKKWLVWFQIFFMWFYFGGNGQSATSGDIIPSSFMFSSFKPRNFFQGATSVSISQIASSCVQYFDYYEYHPDQMTWDMYSSKKNHGICGDEFIGYQIFIAYGQAFALFLMTTFTVVGYLNPGEASSTTKNPAGVEMAA